MDIRLRGCRPAVISTHFTGTLTAVAALGALWRQRDIRGNKVSFSSSTITEQFTLSQYLVISVSYHYAAEDDAFQINRDDLNV